MRRARPVAALVLLLAAAWAWVYKGALFRGETFVERDLATFHRAARSLVPRLVHETGGLPQWNPYYASGQPFAANPQHALFHPITALLLVLPFEWAFRLHVMAPPAVAACAMYFLLRSLGRRRFGAAFGALVWGVGGYMLSVANLLPTLLAVAPLPAVMAFAHRVARGGHTRDAAGLAVALGLLGLAGEPATLLMTPLLVAAVVGQAFLARRIPAPGRTTAPAHRAALLGVGLALGLGLAGAALLPAWALAARTTRAAGLSAAMADNWSMPPLRLAEIVFPYAFGRVETGAWGFWGLRFYPGQTTPFLYSLYMGLLTAALAGAVLVTAATARRRPRARPVFLWCGIAVLGALLAAGRTLPLWPIARRLPFLDGIRYPERFALLVLLPLVILAAQGFDLVIRGSAGTRRVAEACLATAGGLAAVLGLVSLAGGQGPWIRLGLPAEAAQRMPLLAAKDALLVLATALALLLALRAVVRRRCWAPLLLLALTALDLAHVGARLLRTKPAAEMSAAPPVLQPLLPSPASTRVFHVAGWVAQREQEFSFVRPPMPAFWGIPTSYEPDFDLTELRWSSEATGAFLQALTAAPRTGFAAARRRGVGAIIRLRTDIKVVDGSIVKAPGADSAVELRFMDDPPRPLVFVAPRVETATGASGWKDAVLRLGPAAADTAVMEPADAASLNGPPSAGSVALRGQAPGRLSAEVDVQGPGPALVAVNQTWDVFWRARVDEREAQALRTDVSLMGVIVPPGRHRLELSYQDPWIRRGLMLSAVALAALVLLAAWPARGRRPVSA